MKKLLFARKDPLTRFQQPVDLFSVMLLDLFTHLTTSCSPCVRRLGYLDETIAMRSRYRRNKAAWRTHLDNTCAFVLAAAEKVRNRNKVVVLGSGLLLDVPCAELSAMFREVVLMDVVCLPEVRRQIRGYGNVSFIEYDVTNIAERLYTNRQQGIHELPKAVPITSEIEKNAGLVISLNILSQLWVVPRTYASTHRPAIPHEQIEDWCRQIVESHYASLASMSCDVCLVADHEFVKCDHGGSIISRASTLYGLVLPEPDATWTWNIVPAGNDGRSSSKELIVGAWHMHNRTGREEGSKDTPIVIPAKAGIQRFFEKSLDSGSSPE
jgi:hypothetical protein